MNMYPTNEERIAQAEKLGLNPMIISREFANEVFAKGSIDKDGLTYMDWNNGNIMWWNENYTSMFDSSGFCIIED